MTLDLAYSADCDPRFRPNVTGHSAASALCEFLTLSGHDQSTFFASSALGFYPSAKPQLGLTPKAAEVLWSMWSRA